MKRSPLNSDPDKVRAWQQRSRRPLRQQSPKKAAERKDNRSVSEQVFERDGWSCALHGVAEAGPCFGKLTPHHLLKASAGGEHSLENLISLCQYHNGLVEDRPNWAHSVGLVVRMGEVLADAEARRKDAGLGG